MSIKKSLTVSNNTLETLRHVTICGLEYWSARELQSLLGYQHWNNFILALNKAIRACKKSGNDPSYHFTKVHAINTKQIDYFLSRFACYLIVQNCDSSKREIAHAQKYFAVQTRRQEMSDVIAADIERLFVRKQTTKLFKALSGVARNAGIQNNMFHTFHDAGYRGLYGGLSTEDIKILKSIPKEQRLLDRMGTTELAANQFRMTQARDKLAREQVNNPLHAILLHQAVGQEVRQAIKRIGGTMPENLRPAEHIKQVEKRIKQASKLIKLDEKDAKGFIWLPVEVQSEV